MPTNPGTAGLHALTAQAMADPGFQQVLNATYPNLSQKSLAVDSYLAHHFPQIRDLNLTDNYGHGNGAIHFDVNSNGFQWTPIGPQHWYSDPSVIGPIAVGAVAGPAAFGAFGGGAGAAGGAAASGAAAGGGVADMGVLGSTSLASVPGMTGAAPGVIAPVIGAGSVGGDVSAGGFGSGYLGKLFQSPSFDLGLANDVTGLIGAKMQSNATAAAVAAQAKAAADALAFTKQAYAKALADNAPYLQAGQAAIGRLNTMAANAPNPMTLAGLGSGVRMKAPTGDVQTVPFDQVGHYKALGAVEV